ITINPLPVITAIVSDNEICIGEEVIFEGQGGTSYAWSNGVQDGLPYTPSVTNTYTVIGTDANGCQNSTTIDVIVNPLPIISAGTDFAVCEGSSIVLTGTSAGDVDDYTWVPAITNGVSFMPPVGVNTYILTGTNNTTGCSNTDEIIVTV